MYEPLVCKAFYANVGVRLLACLMSTQESYDDLVAHFGHPPVSLVRRCLPWLAKHCTLDVIIDHVAQYKLQLHDIPLPSQFQNDAVAKSVYAYFKCDVDRAKAIYFAMYPFDPDQVRRLMTANCSDATLILAICMRAIGAADWPEDCRLGHLRKICNMAFDGRCCDVQVLNWGAANDPVLFQAALENMRARKLAVGAVADHTFPRGLYESIACAGEADSLDPRERETIARMAAAD